MAMSGQNSKRVYICCATNSYSCCYITSDTVEVRSIREPSDNRTCAWTLPSDGPIIPDSTPAPDKNVRITRNPTMSMSMIKPTG